MCLRRERASVDTALWPPVSPGDGPRTYGDVVRERIGQRATEVAALARGVRPQRDWIIVKEVMWLARIEEFTAGQIANAYGDISVDGARRIMAYLRLWGMLEDDD